MPICREPCSIKLNSNNTQRTCYAGVMDQFDNGTKLL